MLITEVTLDHIKSYTQATIAFLPGINAICGQNGAGKSTILEAIGFALFDYLPYNQDDFVREGEKSGIVTVQFISARDEREYQVIRRCGNRSTYEIYDPTIKQKLVQGKTDVLKWLRDHLKLDEDDNLSDLFANAVGVPQGLLTATFLEGLTQRKAVFNPLLRVDEYERAWERLRDTESYLDKQLSKGREHIARLEPAVKTLPEEQERAATLRQEIATADARLVTLQQELVEVAAQREELLELKQTCDKLQDEIKRLNVTVEGLYTQLANARDLVKAAETAQHLVEQTAEGYQQHQTAQQTIEQLEQQARERDKLERERATHENTRDRAYERQTELNEQRAAIIAAETEIETLSPLVQQQETLENQLREAERDSERLVEAQEHVSQAQEGLDKLQQRLATASREVEQLHQLEQEIATDEEQLRTLTDTISRLHVEQQQLQAQQPQIEQRIALLEETTPATRATCPVCQQLLTAEQAADLAATYRSELRQLVADLEANQQQYQTFAQQQKALEQQRSKRLKQIRKLSREEQRNQLEQDVQHQQDEVSRQTTRVTELSDAPAQVEQLRQQLDNLGNPRHRYEQCKYHAAQHQETDAKLLQVQAEIQTVESQITQLTQALQPYIGLDTTLTETRAIRDRTAEAYQQYLSHVNQAQSLAERQTAVTTLEQQIDSHQQKMASLQQEMADRESRYDEAVYQQRDKDYQRLSDEQTTLNERLRNKHEQLDDANQTVQALQEQQRDLEQAQSEQETLAERATTMSFVRTTLREAGPHITRARVQHVAQEANLIFGEIMNNYALRLAWNETYEITVESLGRQRTFRQLSGGEQMSAALAVRLALIKEMTGIDVAFFDEPTTNLDGERRDNLAEQMMNIRGFAQLFVISHDDTFERSTQHVIRIDKENGISRVTEGG